jgi:membrane glycosyltransferase
LDIAAFSPLRELRENGPLLESHLINLPHDKRRDRGQVDPNLAIARAKIEDAESFEEAVSFLTPRETFAVLSSPDLLRAVCAL